MLKIGNTNEFRILIIADIQDIKPLKKKKQKRLEMLIKRSKPDLIVLLGDMIFGLATNSEKWVSRIVDSILKPINESKIPFALVSGNHDMDSRVSIDKQIEMFKCSSGCLTPLISEREHKGSYSLIVYDHENEPCIQLVFHDCGKTHFLRSNWYDPASNDQIEFEKIAFSEYREIPAFVFQHIPVPEINKLIIHTDKETENTVRIKKHGKSQFIQLKDSKSGRLGEQPCPPKNNSGQFRNWTRNENVKAAVFGHDHKNSFCGLIDGIMLIQTACAGSGFSCYGDDDIRGGRLLIIKQDGSFTTEELLYKEIDRSGKASDRSEGHA